MQRRFWEILTSYYERQLNFPISQISKAEDVQQIAAISHWLTNFFFEQPVNHPKATANQMIDAVYSDGHIFIRWQPDDFTAGVSPSTSIQQRFQESLSSKLDQQMQELIVGETLEFLHSKSSRPLVQKLFVVAECVLFDAMADGARLGLAGADGPGLMVRSPAGVGMSFSFWQVPGNRQIFYHYAVGHLCLWVAMLPWAAELHSEAG